MEKAAPYLSAACIPIIFSNGFALSDKKKEHKIDICIAVTDRTKNGAAHDLCVAPDSLYNSQQITLEVSWKNWQHLFKELDILGKFNNHDWRSTFGTQLKERGLSSAIVTDLLGHADTRMVETTYARTRHEGIMKQREAVEALSSFL